MRGRRYRFADIRLKDWRGGRYRWAKIWVKFSNEFAPVYDSVINSKFETNAEEEKNTATRLALNRFLPSHWWIEHVLVEPLAKQEHPLSSPPSDAFLFLWFHKPSEETRARAAKFGLTIPGKKPEDVEGNGDDEESRHVGGRRGYVVRSKDFYNQSWGMWEPHPNHKELMQYVTSLPTYYFPSPNGAAKFAAAVNERGFLSAEGKKFTLRSVRRLNIAAELLRGNSLPE